MSDSMSISWICQIIIWKKSMNMSYMYVAMSDSNMAGKINMLTCNIMHIDLTDTYVNLSYNLCRHVQ